jgi:alkylation response protein AidB-like acyl-CoA dehydrogenase
VTTAEAREEIVAAVREWVEHEVYPVASDYEHADEYPEPLVEDMKRMGLFGVTIPEEYGGLGLDLLTYVLIQVELSRGWMSLSGVLNTHFISAWMIRTYGTDEQRDRLLPRMATGEVRCAFSMTEPECGSDVQAIRTRAVRDGDDYLVNGTKAWITHGGEADFYTLLARTSDDGSRGISCFLVDASTPGVSAAEPEHKMGFTGSTTAQVRYDDARIGADRLVGAEGQGFKIALAALDGGRLGIAACAVGLAQGALDTALAWAKERRQFGRALVEFQGLAFMLADMATGVEAGRALYWDASRRRDRGEPFGKQAAMAKLFCTDMAMRVTTDAVQVLGGYGYVSDFPVERYFREAKALQIVEGTNQVQRMVIARHLTR